MYAGLAAFYLIRDADDTGAEPNPIGIPGGRYEIPIVIQDRTFTGFQGHDLVLRNLGLPAGVVSPASPNIPLLMQFRVGATVTSPGPATIPSSLPGSLPSFGAPARERFITLEEVLDQNGAPIRSTIDGLRFNDPANIRVPAGDVEDWLLINLSADTHPIHLHLPQFQVVERRPVDVAGYQAALDEAREGGRPNPDPAPFYTGGPLPRQTDDRGLKDTVSANPGVVTRIRSPFDLPSGVTGTQQYVFHCHILEHEDNDMMRPYEVLG